MQTKKKFADLRINKGWYIQNEYRYETGIEYHKKYTLNWVQCVETRSKNEKREVSNFEFVTNFIPDNQNVAAIAHGGRLRWKIENEGFNTQKRKGLELEHKYIRKSYNGMKNYYVLLQIAHMILQLIEKSKLITEILKKRSKETIKNLWTKLKSYMLTPKPIIIYVKQENITIEASD